MKTDGYQIECDVCHKKEFFQEGEDATIVGDWYYGIPDNGGHLCTDCWNSQENTRDEQAKLAQAEDNDQWEKLTDSAESIIPYASAIRDNLNGK